jgi:hypothetical protein
MIGDDNKVDKNALDLAPIHAIAKSTRVFDRIPDRDADQRPDQSVRTRVRQREPPRADVPDQRCDKKGDELPTAVPPFGGKSTSGGMSWTSALATATPPRRTPRKFIRPDQTTA